MERKIALEIEEKPSQMNLKTCLVGVGGAGGNIVSYLYKNLTEQIKKHAHLEESLNIEYVAINTDQQDLTKIEINIPLCIGPNVCHGFGAGSEPEKGKEAAEDSKEEIINLLKDFDFIILFAGLGGGTGTGATPEICKYLLEIEDNRQRTILVVYIYPFSNMESARMLANECIKKTNEYLKNKGSMFLVSNEKFTGIKSVGNSFTDIFTKVNREIEKIIITLIEVLYLPGTINTDFSDMSNVLKKGTIANLSIGKINDVDDEPSEAIKKLKNNICFSEEIFNNAKSAIIYFFSKFFGRNHINEIMGDKTIINAQTVHTILGANEDFSEAKIFLLITSDFTEDLLNKWIVESDSYKESLKPRYLKEKNINEENTISQKEEKEESSIPKMVKNTLQHEPPKIMGILNVDENILDSDTPALARLNNQLRFPKK